MRSTVQNFVIIPSTMQFLHAKIQRVLFCKRQVSPQEVVSSRLTRVQPEQERRMVGKDNANFEFAALFHSLIRRLKKRGNFKRCIAFEYPESFLYILSVFQIQSYTNGIIINCTKLFGKVAMAVRVGAQLSKLITEFLWVRILSQTKL